MSDRFFQFGVFVASMAGYITLAIWGEPTAEYVTLIGPVLAVVILQSRLGGKVDEIYENTNGKLDRRIQNAVRAALDERQPPE